MANVSGSDSDWEIVDPLQSDDDCFSFDELTTDNEDDVDVADLVGSPSSDSPLQPLADGIDLHRQLINFDTGVKDDDLVADPFGYPSSDAPLQGQGDEIGRFLQLINYDAIVKDDDALICGGDFNQYVENGDEYEEEEEEDDVPDDDVYDLDDELVPKWLSNRFERQRIRKLGKRSYPRMNKSKKMAYQYNRPGCVHGKHGLGLEHNILW